MGKTIIQTIGPLYGEVENGTVFGRPNGSIYVPSTNEITIKANGTHVREWTASWGTTYNLSCNSTGTWGASTTIEAVAKAQDVASYIQYQISETADFSDYKSFSMNAGQFNIAQFYLARTDVLTIVADQTYYVRAQLMSANGVPVATSEIVELTGWVEE